MKILLGLALLYVLSGCSTKPYVVSSIKDENLEKNIVIFVTNHGWHTGLSLPAKELYTYIPSLRSRFPAHEYLEIGWGDKGFYQAEEITTDLTIKAIFWPTETVMHVVGVSNNVSEYFSNSQVIQLCISREQLSRLNQFIGGSFNRSSLNEVVPLRNGIYGDSQFYEGTGLYYLFNTCNKWTAKALKSAGIDISTTFKLTASSVMSDLHGVESCEP